MAHHQRFLPPEMNLRNRVLPLIKGIMLKLRFLIPEITIPSFFNFKLYIMKKNILKLILISGLFVFLLVTYTKLYSACSPTLNTECYNFDNGKGCLGGGEAGNCSVKPQQ